LGWVVVDRQTGRQAGNRKKKLKLQVGTYLCVLYALHGHQKITNELQRENCSETSEIERRETEQTVRGSITADSSSMKTSHSSITSNWTH
jgi:peptide subunit release factor 1 (eRF1)